MGASAAVLPLAGVPERSQIKLVAAMARGDTFARMLQRAGVSADDAAHAMALVAAQTPLDGIDSATRFDVVLGKRAAPGSPRRLERIDFRARFDLDLSVVRQGEGLGVIAHPLSVDATPLRIRGTVGSASLYRSARAAGAPMKAIQQYLQTLDSHLSLDSDVASTDKFDFIVAYKRSAGGESETGELLYAGLERGGKPLAQLVRWGPDGQFFDAAGGIGSTGEARAATFAPVNGRMTSSFGMRRHPILGYTRLHAGVDFGAAWGSPIFAVSDGVVSLCRAARRPWQLCAARAWRRARHRLWPHEQDRRVAGQPGPRRAGDRLCRLDRAFHRAASALGGLQQWPHGQSAVGALRRQGAGGRSQAGGSPSRRGWRS